MNQIPPNALYSSNSGISSTSPFVEFFSLVDPTIYDVNFPIQKRWFNTTTNVEWILIGFSTSSGSLTANWQPISVGDDNDIVQHYALVGGPDHTITSVNPSTAGLVLTSNGPFVDPSFQPVSLNSESQYATFLVNPTSGEGTHTTIQAAIDDASSGDTIFIYGGTYTEDIVAISGITISGYGYSPDNPSSVKIIGNFQYSGSGRITLNGIILQTNGNYALSVTGASVSYFSMYNGGILATNNTGILFSTTGGVLALIECRCNVSAPTGSCLFDATGADATSTLLISECDINNSGISTTTNTCNASLSVSRSFITIPLSTAGTADCVSLWSYHLTQSSNTPAFTLNSVGNVGIDYCFINSGSASCVISTAGSGGVSNCFLATGNALAINAPFSLVSYCNSYPNNGSAVNCVQAAAALGLIGTTPSQFAIGELLRQNTTPGSAVSLTTNTPANVTSVLTLSPGTWTISGIIGFITNAATSVTQIQLSLSTTSATLATDYGLDTIANTFSAQIGIQQTLTLPSLVVTVTTNTDYYLVTQSTFTLNTMSAYGTITAQRTG